MYSLKIKSDLEKTTHNKTYFTLHTYHSLTNGDQHMKINKPEVSGSFCPAGGVTILKPVPGCGSKGVAGVGIEVVAGLGH